ncbi:MAG: 30S ribosomal protein S7 [Bdellovibrionaceae bacterium]|uniref:Small ribosomal subunit protein uS7 n=1 Tax=Candidatus Dojkabacteria bacterium TaxID=2099670 RepID=A0A955RJ94_9BACT|nr:30S ribosomal protein S7 [Candidatus Dojkabacteria bacterium]MCB9072150.1 30S ribosomal protein S7 [Pseudobdellovibrionaceae bacterium]
MSRRKGSYKREVVADPVYNDTLITKFVNKVMYDGKKSVAFGLVYGALDELKGKVANEEPLSVFKKAVENCKPQLEVRSRRVGGATYQVPVDVRPSRRTALAINWIVETARDRGEKDMSLRLAGELLDAFNNRGNAIKKKEDVHRMADANRAFSHYNW